MDRDNEFPQPAFQSDRTPFAEATICACKCLTKQCRLLAVTGVEFISLAAAAIENLERKCDMQASLANESSGSVSERRHDKRHVAVMLLAKLTSEHNATICRIRNISALGAQIESNVALVKNQPVALELRSDLKMNGRVAWSDGCLAGVQFETAIDVNRYLTRSESRIDRIKVRAPRFQCHASIFLIADGQCIACHATDISLSGMGLASLPARAMLKNDQIVSIIADGLSLHKASVTWSQGDRIGLRFRHPLKYTDLQEWLADYSVPSQDAVKPFEAAGRTGIGAFAGGFGRAC